MFRTRYGGAADETSVWLLEVDCKRKSAIPRLHQVCLFLFTAPASASAALSTGQLNDPLHMSPPPTPPSPPRGLRGRLADNIKHANLLHRSNLVVVVTPTRCGWEDT